MTTAAGAAHYHAEGSRSAGPLLQAKRFSCDLRPLRYSSNVTLDGCCDHRAIPADEDLHRHAVENLNQADALLFGRVTYEMMEAAWRPPTGARPDWMEPFAQTINAAKKYVVSSTLERVDWNAELVRGAVEACRLEAPEPAGVRLGGSGDAVRAEKVAIGLASPSRPHHGALVRGS